MKKRRLRPWVIITFTTICLIGVIYYSYQVIMWNKHIKDNNKIQDEIKDTIKVKKDKIDFKSLKEINPDTIAYLKVPNTNIDYVVVKGKDNDYYLNHNFKKEWNIAGWIYADYHNKFDNSDKNIIIYGHNTKDNSMFGTLKNVLDSTWYNNESNHKITLLTETNKYYYEVFSTYTIKPETYYINTEFNNDKEFDKFIKTIKSRSTYNYNIEVGETDKILTLSSCVGDGHKRLVLHARLIN